MDMQVVVVKRMYGDITSVIAVKGDADDHVRDVLDRNFDGIRNYEPEGDRTGSFETVCGDYEFTVMSVEGLRAL